jgi:hypothetical protein
MSQEELARRDEELRARYGYLIAYDDAQLQILDNFRHRDQAIAFKSGAVLGFSGLMIASSLVQMSAGVDSVLHIDGAEPWFPLFSVGLVLLFGSAIFALSAIISGTTRNDASSIASLERYERLVTFRRNLMVGSVLLSLLGTISTLAGLVLVFEPLWDRWAA